MSKIHFAEIILNYLCLDLLTLLWKCRHQLFICSHLHIIVDENIFLLLLSAFQISFQLVFFTNSFQLVSNNFYIGSAFCNNHQDCLVIFSEKCLLEKRLNMYQFSLKNHINKYFFRTTTTYMERNFFKTYGLITFYNIILFICFTKFAV